MDSRGSSILGRASSSEDSTCNQEDYDRSQSYQNHFFDALRKNPEMCSTLHTSSNALKDDEKTAQNTTNIYFRIPASLNSRHEIKESNNEDNTSIDSTDCSVNRHANNDAQTSNNPFTFTSNVENAVQVNASKTAQNTKITEEKTSSDNTLITINTITNLLKQLQELCDKEHELAKKEKGSPTPDDTLLKDNIHNQKSTSDNRKKSRPQLLIKKMKYILSTSNGGIKHENTKASSIDKVSELSKKEVENNEVADSADNSLTSLRLEKLQMSMQTLSVVDSLRGIISEHMPGVVRRRAQKCSSVSPSPSINGISSNDELPLLLGRCFNLSVNLKILKQCNYSDPAIGCRVFVDFDVLENYLRRKVQECEEALNIKQRSNEGNLLCPEQLETKINSLSIRSQNSDGNLT